MTLSNVDEFNARLREFTRDVVPSHTRRVITNMALEILRRVVRRTPVDTGQARGNWQVGINQRPTGVLKATDASGSATIARGTAAVRGAPNYSTIYIVNNVPHAWVLEHGLFVPKNPGPSRDPRKGRRGRVLVRNGYSVQAPKGMVALTLAELGSMFK